MIAPLLFLSRKLHSFCHRLGKKIIIIAAKGVILVQNFEMVTLFSLL